MGAAERDRQVLRQGDGQRLQRQRIAGRPEVDLVTIGERDPVEQAEAIAPRRQLGADAVLLLRPIAAKLPDIGMVGKIPPPFAPPGEGGVQDACLLYTPPSPRDGLRARMPSPA